MQLTSISLALAAALSSVPQEPAPAEEPRVAVALVSDHVQIAAGEEFEVAARFTVPAGWHIGWTNPGDFGAPTQARLALPKGFEAGTPTWIAPRSFALEDGRVTFGYADEACALFRVRAPRDLLEGSRVELTLNAEWIALGPGEAARADKQRTTLSLATYPLRDAQPSATPAWMAAQRARAPRAWKQLENAALDWKVVYADTGEGLGLELAFDVEGASELEWFPHAIAGLDWAGSNFVSSADGLALAAQYVWLSADKAASPDARGVLRVVRDGVEGFFEARASRPTPLARR